MTTWNRLSRPLRLAFAAPWLLVLALATAALEPAFHALQVNATTHQPAEPLNLGSGNVIGTLSDARLPANVVRFATNGSLTTANLAVSGSLFVDDVTHLSSPLTVPQIYSRGGDPSIDLSNPNTGYLRDDGIPALAWTYDRVIIQGDLETSLARIGSDGTASFADGQFVIGADGSYFANNADVQTLNVSQTMSVSDAVVSNSLFTQAVNAYGVSNFYAPVISNAPIFANSGLAVSLDINAYGDIHLSGSLCDANGNQVLTPSGDLNVFGTVSSGSNFFANGATNPTLYYGNSASLTRTAAATLTAGNGTAGDAGGTYRASFLRLKETNSQPATASGEATFWIRSSDHKACLVDATGTNHVLW